MQHDACPDQPAKPPAYPRHDEADARAARQAMVRTQILARGIRDPGVLDALATVPRERFLPEGLPLELVYSDQALSLSLDQTISQPFIVGWMTAALDVQAGHKVLEVGTGSGYQAAVLAMLGAKVYSIERLPELAAQARRNLAAAGLPLAKQVVGDGSLGMPDEAPFDRIVVTAASPGVPPALCQQLAVGGRLVIPVGGTAGQILVRVDRGRRRLVETPGLRCRFVRLVGNAGWPEE